MPRANQYVNSSGPNQAGIILGFAWLDQLAQSDPAKKTALLAVDTKNSLEDRLSGILTKNGIKALMEGKAVKVTDHFEVRLLITRDRSTYDHMGPVFAVYPNQDLLDKIDTMPGVTDVLVLPWQHSMIKPWMDAWSPTQLGQAASPVSPVSLSDPVVEVALEELTNSVNLSTGITHPSDDSRAKETFRVLVKGGHRFDVDDVRAWLVGRGWQPRDADAVREVASGAVQGKHFRNIKYPMDDRDLKRWRDKASGTP